MIDGGFKQVFEPKHEQFTGDYELWKDLLTTSLCGLLPNEDFSLYILAHGKEGRPLPIYYLELCRDTAKADRGGELFLVWEMDQGNMKRVEGNSSLSRGLDMAEYAHSYIKIFFFIKERDMEEQSAALRIDRCMLANLKRSDEEWDEWLIEQHQAKSTDALVAIILIGAALAGSLVFNEPIISVFAGIIVAGIASEEWLAPQAVVFGAIARFLKNEALALRMYYRTNFSIGIRSLLITLLASAGELSVFFNSSFGTIKLGGADFTGAQALLIVAAGINIFCLLPCALSYFYEGVRVQDLPKDKYLQPKVFISEQYPFFLRFLEKTTWPPTTSTKNVARIRLHWSRGGYNNNIENFLSGTTCAKWITGLCGSEDEAQDQDAVNQSSSAIVAPEAKVEREESIEIEGAEGEEKAPARLRPHSDVIIDLAAPGSPSSMRAMALSLPATSKVFHSHMMKGTFLFDGEVSVGTKLAIIPLLLLEYTLVFLGACLIMICDIPAAMLLGIARILLKVFPYEGVQRFLYWLPFPLAGYNLADVLLIVYSNVYTPFAIRFLGMTTMTCRSKSMARWYRLPRMLKVRTGRQSNHAWRSGSYFRDQYFIAGDIVVMNPRWPLMGLANSSNNVNGNNKCVWTSRGRKYCNPSLVY